MEKYFNFINCISDCSFIYQIDTWMNHSSAFQGMCKKIETMFDHFIEIPNRCLLQQLYPYIYDVKEIANRASHYIRYLGKNMYKIAGLVSVFSRKIQLSCRECTVLANQQELSFNPLMYNVTKWSGTL